MGVKSKKAAPKRAVAKKTNARKSFTAAAADAAKAAVETVTVRAKDKAPRRSVSFEVVDSVKKTSSSESKSTAAAAAAKRAVVGGIIQARKRNRKEDEEEEEMPAHDREDDSDSEGSADSNSDGEENLSELADSDNTSEASDKGGWENPFEKSKREGTRLSYEVLRLRFLPPEFQEPQLFKFLSQFGATVLNAFCVRSRRTHQSKGIAYVQFDSPAVLPTVVEECHGMSLGGRAVQAHAVTLHRAMPSKEKVARRRQLAYAYKTKGAPLRHHDLRKKNPIASLVKYTRVEKANNEHLKRLGIDYSFHGFEEQLKNVPSNLIIGKKKNKKGKKNASSEDCTAVVSSTPAPIAPHVGKDRMAAVGMKKRRLTFTSGQEAEKGDKEKRK